MFRWRLALTALVTIGSLGFYGVSLAAPLLQEDQVVISSPGDNATVSGQVEIVGTVTHPSFVSYGVLYAPGPAPTFDSQWQEIVFGVEEPVVNGILVVWDTAARTEDDQPLVPDGVYTLALARYREGSDAPDLHFVRNITVHNEGVEQETETPTPTLPPLPTAASGTPAAMPVEQPPTPTLPPSPTPRPGETPIAAPADDGEAGGNSLPIDVSRLRRAFLDGVEVTLALFVAWGLYVLGKASVRYLLRTGRLELPELPWRK